MPDSLSDADLEKALDDVAGIIVGAPDYGDFIPHRNRYRSDARRVAEHYRDGPILEVGSIPGHFTLLLKRLGYPCIGVDLAPDRYAERIARAGLDVRRCDIENQALPFADASFDLVVCSEVLEHLRVDPLFALSEINRVLRPGGTLLLTTPNLYAIQRIVKMLLGRGFNDPLEEFMKLRLLGHMGHIREYSATEVQRFLAFSGFRSDRLSFDHCHYPAGRRGFATRLLFAVLPKRLRSFQEIVARKTSAGSRLLPLA